MGFGVMMLAFIGFSLSMTPTMSSMNMRQVFAESVEAGNFRRAEVAVGALLAQSPESPEYRYQKALVDLKLEKPDAARAAMQQLAEEEHALASLWLISQDFDLNQVTSWDAKQHTRFRRLMESALANATGNDLTSSRVLMAGYFAAMHNDGEALRFYDQVVEVRPEYVLSALAIASRQLDEVRVKRFSRIAEKHLGDRLAKKPTDVAARIALANTLVITGRAKEASQLLNDGFRLGGKAELAVPLGTALLAWANSLEATSDNALKRMQILQSAIGVSPYDQRIAQQMIGVLVQCRDHSDPKVRQTRDKILAATNKGTGEFIRGTVALLENRFEVALKHLRNAGRQQPNMPAILNNLAVAISSTPGSNLEHALILVSESLAANPTHPYFLETRGSILAKMERWEEAIVDLEQAMHATELKPMVLPTLAVAYRKVGKLGLAREFEMLAQNAQ